MKVAVINFSGNVGKTIVAKHLLAPRLDGPTEISVETVNSDGADDEAMRGRQFGELHEILSLVDNAVVDVGASNAEDFVGRMAQYHGSHEEFDYFVVPVSPKEKPQRDTIATIEVLAGIGVPPAKMLLVFNMVETIHKPEHLFPGLFAYQADKKKFTINPAAVIHENEIFERLKSTGTTLAELLADTADYRKKIKESGDADERIRYARMIATKRLAGGIAKEFDAVFKALFNQ
jgi:hypothetical protein